jgi:hypothetical protein
MYACIRPKVLMPTHFCWIFNLDYFLFRRLPRCIFSFSQFKLFNLSLSNYLSLAMYIAIYISLYPCLSMYLYFCLYMRMFLFISIFLCVRLSHSHSLSLSFSLSLPISLSFRVWPTNPSSANRGPEM